MSEPWSKERHAAARARCDEATPGPWFCDEEAPFCPVVWTGYEDAFGGAVAEYMQGKGYIKAADEYPRGANYPAESMRFIAAARTDLPDALTRIEHLEEALQRFTEPAAWHCAVWPHCQHAGCASTFEIAEIARAALNGESS